MSRCHSGVRNLYPTCTFTGILYDLLAVALYIYPIDYNKTLFALVHTMCHSQLSSMWQLMYCLFSFPMLIWHSYSLLSVILINIFSLHILVLFTLNNINIDSWIEFLFVNPREKTVEVSNNSVGNNLVECWHWFKCLGKKGAIFKASIWNTNNYLYQRNPIIWDILL